MEKMDVFKIDDDDDDETSLFYERFIAKLGEYVESQSL